MRNRTNERRVFDLLATGEPLTPASISLRLNLEYSSVRKALYRLNCGGRLRLQRIGRAFCYAIKPGVKPPDDGRGQAPTSRNLPRKVRTCESN